MSACPFYCGSQWSSCQAVDGAAVPSLHERERYCREGGAHRRCPTFAVVSARGRRLSEREHLALLCDGPERLLEALPPAPPAFQPHAAG